MPSHSPLLGARCSRAARLVHGHDLDARLAQPVDDQPLEHRRESGPGLRPGDLHLEHAVLVALHPWHLGHQHRAQLARVQVAPAALPAVVAARDPVALGAPQVSGGAHLQPHAHLLALQVELDIGHRPRSLKVEDLGVQVAVAHPARLRRPPPVRLPPLATPASGPPPAPLKRGRQPFSLGWLSNPCSGTPTQLPEAPTF